MLYYAIQVKTGTESKYLRLAGPRFSGGEERLLWPRRKLRIRRRGRYRDVEASIFPGYIFLETDKLSASTYWILRRTNEFLQFLPGNRRIEPLGGPDEALLRHFLSFGEVLEKSKVYFDENKRIRVLQGALKGLEGRIVKVDRRKRRAKVALALYENSFLIDFGFDVLEPAEVNERSIK